MKIKILTCLLSLFICVGCSFDSIIDFENKEISSKELPENIPDDILEKYKIGDVIILADVKHDNPGLSTYFIRISAFSKNEAIIIFTTVRVFYFTISC